MSTFYVYPQIFDWDQIIPVDYPFIHIKGPDGAVGVLMVFATPEKYTEFCEGKFKQPLLISQEDKPNGKQDRSRKTKGQS